MVVNYNNGKIYKIINENCETVYIGSTTQSLCQRYTRHNHKAPNHKIILIENYSCNSKEELCKREQEIIDEHSLLLNKYRAFGIDESRRKEYKIKHYKEYREQNKDKIKQKQKEYRENNKEKKKKYYENNKEKIQEYYNKKVKCEFCNKETNYSNLRRHQKSKKCISFQTKI